MKIVLEFPALEYHDLIYKLKRSIQRSAMDHGNYPGKRMGGSHAKRMTNLYDNYYKIRKADEMITIRWIELGGLDKEIADEQTNCSEIS